jgi:hypothetical protein
VPLVTNVDDNIDEILDEALAEYHTQLNARVDDMHRELAVDTKPVREQLWDFKDYIIGAINGLRVHMDRRMRTKTRNRTSTQTWREIRIKWSLA